MDVDLPTQSLRDHWAEVEADAEATADELAADGWTTVTLHPGDVTTHLGGNDRPAGLAVMVADNEFEAVTAQLEAGATFDHSAVFRQAAGGVAFLVFVMRDPDLEIAVLVPAFYPQRGEAAMAIADATRDAGGVHVHVRPLGRDRVVTFTIDDPSLVFPSG